VSLFLVIMITVLAAFRSCVVATLYVKTTLFRDSKFYSLLNFDSLEFYFSCLICLWSGEFYFVEARSCCQLLLLRKLISAADVEL